MPPDERQLPLFPLNTVLFPNASLPLQIFEERYKLMLQHCLDADSKFGIVLIKSGIEVGEPATPYSTGTVAHIVQVDKVDGGRMFISVAGRQRFQIKTVTQYHPYMSADVLILDDEPEAKVPAAKLRPVREAATRYIRLVMGLRGGWIRDSKGPSDPEALSYFVAGILQIGLPEKQLLLEEPSAAQRLETELDLLKRESEILKQRVSLELRRGFSRQ